MNESSDIEKQNTSSTANAKKLIMQKIGGRGDHFTRYGSSQWALCTKEVYDELTNVFNLRNWQGFKEYESLRQEYESLRFVHNLDQNHNNVFRYKRDSGENFHACQKPVEMLERIIRCSSNKDDVVLDCFMGSGSTGVAAKKTGRKFIGIERDDDYFKICEKRISEAVKDIMLFDNELETYTVTPVENMPGLFDEMM